MKQTTFHFHRSLVLTIFLGVFFASLVSLMPLGHAAVQVDIFGPGQGRLNLAIAEPLTAIVDNPVAVGNSADDASMVSPSAMPKAPVANALGQKLNALITENMSFLPFIRMTDSRTILGGTVLQGYKAPYIDLRRFQIAGSDLVITAGWPDGDAEKSFVELRVYEVFSGKLVFGRAYSNVEESSLVSVADRFSADFMAALTGRGEFFSSTLAFVKQGSQKTSDVWLVKPTGRKLRKITDMGGQAMSPSWSFDGRFVVFAHMDDRTHALGVWDRITNRVQRIRFQGNTVIGPCFMPDNKVAVSLSLNSNPDIYLLNHKFQRERALEANSSINVSPSFDAEGKRMAFVSSRLGGPQIFMKDLTTGEIRRISKIGGYNTEPSISPDGTLVAFTKLTPQGHRIFVYDVLTDTERQVTFGPGRDEQPAFAPDSYFLAYTSNRSGQSQIYLVTRHGGDPKRVPTGSGPASTPRWGIFPE
ncbi:MAG: translocation protein TolB [Pseudomonadota bacterium]